MLCSLVESAWTNLFIGQLIHPSSHAPNPHPIFQGEGKRRGIADLSPKFLPHKDT